MKQPHQYRPLEQQPQHDACGIGAVVNISGQRTHETLDGALKIVEKLAHRTGKDADGTTGDGVGVMTQLPHALFQKAAQQAGQTLPDAGDYGAAMIFFPQDPLKRMRSRKLLEMILSREGLELSGDPERKGPEQHALHRAVLHPPPGHGSARAGF